jgi:L-tryptophan--pyruvate aminotransferase
MNEEKDLVDLTWGNSEFLEPYWASDSIAGKTSYISALDLNHGMRYEKEGGRDTLKSTIKDLHDLIGNAYTTDKHIVIGNGATQLLVAAINSLHEIHDLFGAYSRRPHYLRFPTLFNMAGVTRITDEALIPIAKPVVEVVTAPNNPDNVFHRETKAPFKIHDLCYNWPHFTKPIPFDKDIMIFSLAKATGHAGSRIGWALVKDKEMAEMMSFFVEMATNGISIEAQERAALLLRSQIDILDYGTTDTQQTVFDYGKKILDERWGIIRQVAVNKKDFKILNNSGMFAYARYGKEDMLRSVDLEFAALTGIAAVPGDLMGGKSNELRFNIGVSQEKFDAFIEALKNLP